jgi:hypothetical protein
VRLTQQQQKKKPKTDKTKDTTNIKKTMGMRRAFSWHDHDTKATQSSEDEYY